MQSSQRTKCNLALDYAILQANKFNRPLLVFFGVDRGFPEANQRHFTFMLQGLQETERRLEELGVNFLILDEPPDKGVVELAKDACMVVVDKGYLRTVKQWLWFAAEHVECALVQVEDNVVVPVEEASRKEEYSAATFRPKILKKQDDFLAENEPQTPRLSSTKINLNVNPLDLTDIDKTIRQLKINHSVPCSKRFLGGTSKAETLLQSFLKTKLPRYSALKNDPSEDCVSNLSPYLHFGQISPIHVVIETLKSAASQTAKEAFLDELIVRRELAINFVNYNPNYDTYQGLPEWSKQTLKIHIDDLRENLYDLETLENAKTSDPYWNAAQKEMLITGKMHGYMRMYWGKRLLEWTKTPQEAFKNAIYLNNKYELDGRDPNGYAGVAWCFGKHDRPWKSRSVYGSIRYMNTRGLERKFNMQAYTEKVNRLIEIYRGSL